MTSASKSNKRSKKKTSSGSKINPLHCPDGMSLEDWQRALRRQYADKSILTITPPKGPGDCFLVYNPKSMRRYDVEYYGHGNPLNRCECLDFKTSGLGTCKHLEAIDLESEGKYRSRHMPEPENTRIRIDYTGGRKIRLYPGTDEDINKRMQCLTGKFFDDSGLLRDNEMNPVDFIHNAREIDPLLDWDDDAFDLLIEQRERIHREKIINGKYKDSDFKGLLKTSLHPYQADGVRFAFKAGKSINADEMGLGKTVQAIATAELLRKENLVDSVIIICPTSLKYQWLAEIRKFCDSTVKVIEGNALKRQEAFSGNEFYKICSFHSICNDIKGGFIPRADMIIFDEVQRLKNWDTQMGRQLRKLSSPYVMSLSGTPLENKLVELYSVMQLVDQYILGPYYQFTADTTLTDDLGKVVGYKNLHEVADKLSATLIRRRKAEVKLQMPSRTDTNLFVPMTEKQMAIHEEYKQSVAQLIFKWQRMRFLSEKDRKRLLLFLSMMRMVCDSTFILDQSSRNDTKIDETMEIVRNLLESGESKVVIFSQWERMLRILSFELEKLDVPFCFLHGGVPSNKRKDLIDNFRDNPECRIFLSTDAGSTGLNLQSASLIINLDLPWNPAVLEQRIARIYRIGQKNPVQVINMVARNTIEERMIGKLRFKSDLAAGILDGGEDAVFLDNKKFDRIMELVEDAVTHETPSEEIISTESDSESSSGTVSPAYEPVEDDTTVSHTSATEAPEMQQRLQDDPRRGEGATREKNAPTPERKDMKRLVSDGMNFLTGLAAALSTPESTQALVDTIVKEDPETGETALNIPVPDKAAVTNFLTAISSLISR